MMELFAMHELERGFRKGTWVDLQPHCLGNESQIVRHTHRYRVSND